MPKARTVLLEEMNWPQVERAIREGARSVIVPLGATEQHGPGLPLSTDTLHAMEVARRAAEELGDVLVAPALPLGYSPEHAAFAGTITLREETLLAVLRDIVESLARSGFTFIYFWLGHGGDTPVVKRLLAEVRGKKLFPNEDRPSPQPSPTGRGSERPSPAPLESGLPSPTPGGRGGWAAGRIRVAGPDVAAFVAEVWDTVPVKESIDLAVSGSHAGEFEASLVAAMAPGLLDRAALAAGDPRPLGDVFEQMMRDGIGSIAANGVLGDQRPADAARGERYLAAMTKYLVGDFRKQRAGAAEAEA